MNYYTKPKKFKIKRYVVCLLFLVIIFNVIIYFFDKNIIPAVIEISKTRVNAEATQIISETSIELFDEEFKYDEMIVIDKDKEDNINLIRANTVMLNRLTSELTIQCNEKLKEMGKVGIKVPVFWITDNQTFYNLGPKITVKIEPIGNMKAVYESKFESAGVNQTRHTIYLKVQANVRIIMPIKSEDILVECEIPVAETIIVGKTPNTAIDISKWET